MPISHKYKVIFIHIPKTGGTSIEYALGMHGYRDLVGEKPYFNQKRNWDTLFGKGLQHMTIEELKAIVDRFNFERYHNLGYVKWKWDVCHFLFNQYFLPKRIHPRNKVFTEYFKFSFVRNPYDRLVSSFCWYQEFILKKHGEISDFHKFLVDLEGGSKLINDTHFKPQYVYLMSGEKLLVDDIYHFETLEEDFYKLYQKLGVNKKLPHRMKGNHDEYLLYYTEEIKKIAYTIYKKDFEYFGYLK